MDFGLEFEQVAVHVDDVEAALALFRDELGLEFPNSGGTTVAGVRFEARGTANGFVFAGGTGEPEGVRAVGFRVRDLDAVIAVFSARGQAPVRTIEAGAYREAQFEYGGVVYSFAQYTGASRFEGAASAGVVGEHD